jgi:hypothetical protein
MSESWFDMDKATWWIILDMFMSAVQIELRGIQRLHPETLQIISGRGLVLKYFSLWCTLHYYLIMPNQFFSFVDNTLLPEYA